MTEDNSKQVSRLKTFAEFSVAICAIGGLIVAVYAAITSASASSNSEKAVQEAHRANDLASSQLALAQNQAQASIEAADFNGQPVKAHFGFLYVSGCFQDNAPQRIDYYLQYRLSDEVLLLNNGGARTELLSVSFETDNTTGWSVSVIQGDATSISSRNAIRLPIQLEGLSATSFHLLAEKSDGPYERPVSEERIPGFGDRHGKWTFVFQNGNSPVSLVTPGWYSSAQYSLADSFSRIRCFGPQP